MLRAVKILTSILLMKAVLGCTPGVFTGIDSTAPSFGPIYVGITREDAEKHLGYPLMIMKHQDMRYWIVYGYEPEIRDIDIMYIDSLDFITFGLSALIISPIDRFKGPRHLIAVNYEVQDAYEENDRVIDIRDNLEYNPDAISWTEKSLSNVQNGEWEEAISTSSKAISLYSNLSLPYINRARAYYKKGLYDEAIQDCNKAIRIDPDSALAYNHRGLAYKMKGEPEKALEDYKRACKLGLESACNNLKDMKE